MLSTKNLSCIICLISFIFIDFYLSDSSYQQEEDIIKNNNNNETQVSVEISIDETEDNQTDRTIIITGGSSDVSNIIDKVVQSELEKTTEDIESKLGKFSTDEEWDEYMKTQPTFEVKVNVKIDPDILDDVIIISLRSANNYENQEINVVDGKKQKLEFHINDFSYSEYDICAIGKTSKDVYDCNNGLYDDAVEKVSLKVD